MAGVALLTAAVCGAWHNSEVNPKQPATGDRNWSSIPAGAAGVVGPLVVATIVYLLRQRAHADNGDYYEVEERGEGFKGYDDELDDGEEYVTPYRYEYYEEPTDVMTGRRTGQTMMS